MKPLLSRDLFDYGWLALPTAVAGLPLYLHVPDYYVTEQGMSVGLIGVLMLVARIADAVQDPLIGWFSDFYRNLRLTIVLVGVTGLGIGLVALFNPPSGAGSVWLVSWMIFSATAYSIISINLNTLGGLWSEDHHERTRIVAAREMFALVGVIVGVVVPGILIRLFDPSTGYSYFSFAIFAGLILAWLRFREWFVRNRRLNEGGETCRKLSILSVLPKCRRVRWLLLVTLLSALASALPAVLFLFFVRDRLGMESWSWLFLLFYFGAGMAGFAFWRNTSKKWGKLNCWRLSLLGSILVFIGACFVGEGDGSFYALICLGSGFFLGGDMVFPASLLADYIGRSVSGREAAGSAYAWLSFTYKFALGVAAGVAFPVLDALRFQSGEINSEWALLGLSFLYAGLPVSIRLIAALLVQREIARAGKVDLYEESNDKDLGPSFDGRTLYQRM